MVGLLVEALFAAIFARALITFLRTRDPLQRDVMLMFGTVATFFVLALVRTVFGEPPRIVNTIAAALQR